MAGSACAENNAVNAASQGVSPSFTSPPAKTSMTAKLLVLESRTPAKDQLTTLSVGIVCDKALKMNVINNRISELFMSKSYSPKITSHSLKNMKKGLSFFHLIFT